MGVGVTKKKRGTSGPAHYKYNGGYKNKGTLPWANRLLYNARLEANGRGGYAPPNTTSEYVVGLWKGQAGKCAVSGEVFGVGPTEGPVLDHDHETGQVRGFIKGRFNRGLGLLKDNPSLLRASAEYLERHQCTTKQF